MLMSVSECKKERLQEVPLPPLLPSYTGVSEGSRREGVIQKMKGNEREKRMERG
jgi:hypothetical protein